YEIWCALLNGATTVVVGREAAYEAEVLGNISLFDGQVTAVRDGIAELAVDGLETSLFAVAGEAREGMRGTVGVRPEKVRIAREGSAPLTLVNRLRGTVEGLAYLGDVTSYRVRTQQGHLVEITRANSETGAAREVDWDDRVEIWFEPGNALLLGAD
ncbi:MAG: TOBE domain-containing protein, partial [Nisaea sp.]|uniref:TOBE domain-containing protein n=1 Tax=Nisaea sp. TaxID=2024842 RepID=UPI001B1DCBEB